MKGANLHNDELTTESMGQQGARVGAPFAQGTGFSRYDTGSAPTQILIYIVLIIY